MNPHLFNGVDEFKTALPDGESVCLRPVASGDRQILQHGMSLLSKQSRLFRFFSPISILTNEQLTYFTEVDQHQHVAWLALNDRQCGLGIARFIQSQQQPHMAEFALVVIDSYQQRGLGSLLLALLYVLAITEKIEILRAAVQLENTVMSNWLQRLGAIGEYHHQNFYMNLSVSSDLSTLNTPSGQLLKNNIMNLMNHLKPNPR